MAKKSKIFTDAEKSILRSKKLDWRLWTLLQNMPNTMIIKHTITGEVKVIEKKQIPN